MQVCRYAGMQVCSYAGRQACRCMQVACRYASVGRYAGMQAGMVVGR